MKGCRVLTSEEVKNVLQIADVRDKGIFLTQLTFGSRISETLELTFGDVTGKYLALKSSKGSDNQSFPIPESYKAVIAELKTSYESDGITVNPSTHLFMSNKSEFQHKAMTRQQASNIISKLCNALGIEGKVNTHSFRKNFVSKIYEMLEYNIVETQTYSRHKNLSNLQYYIATTGNTDKVLDLVW